MEPGSQSNYHPERPIQYTDIMAYVMEKYGVKIHGSHIAAVKRMCGLEVQECKHKSKTGKPRKEPSCPAGKAEYIKEALRHFGFLAE